VTSSSSGASAWSAAVAASRPVRPCSPSPARSASRASPSPASSASPPRRTGAGFARSAAWRDAAPPGDPGAAPGVLLLVEADASEAELEAAGAVVAFAQFRTEALDAQADIVFPAQVYAEKEGTVTHPDGRIQRVRQAIGHPGDSRPAWSTLVELCERLGAGTGALSSPAVTALVAEAVPFYAGLTLDEIGGDGVRWHDRDAASAVPGEELSTEPLAEPPAAPEGLVLGSAPSLWSGPAIEHSPSLGFLDTGAHALLSLEDARRLGIAGGDAIELDSSGDTVAATAVIRTGVPAGSVFLSPPLLAEGPVEVHAHEAVPT
jgi:NADH-quinone oxidoreductase subunit G